MKLEAAELSDLIERSQAGDKQAFMQLVKSHQNLVYALLYRMLPEKHEVEDVAQDVWLKVYQSLRRLKSPAAFRSWLHRIVMNTFRDRMRQRGNKIAFSLDDRFDTSDGDSVQVEFESPGLLPEEELLQGEWKDHLEQAIENLPLSHRTVIIMREMQGMSYDEIAYALDISLGTVKSRIARAREKLIKSLADYVKEKNSND